MMFVSGETGDVTPDTTSMIESIVQQQVMEMVRTTHMHMRAFWPGTLRTNTSCLTKAAAGD